MAINQKAIERLDPANFGFVMATGILSIAFYFTDYTLLSLIFFGIALLGYIGLISLFVIHYWILGKRSFQDVYNVEKLFKLLTFSAGTNTLAQRVLLQNYDSLGLALGIVGAVSTIILVYGIFFILFFHVIRPIQAISPFWLLMSIACNSTDIVISTLWDHGVLVHPIFMLVGFAFWTFGVVIYFMFMTLNIYRMLFIPFTGSDLNPAYWTCMGGAAIAVVGGSKFVIALHPPLFIISATPFIQGMVVLLWLWGTIWIPILCAMGVWKWLYFKMPVKYYPSLWAMVFPLGMYAVSIYYLARSDDLGFLNGMLEAWLWIAFAIWVCVAMISRFNPFRDETKTTTG